MNPAWRTEVPSDPATSRETQVLAPPAGFIAPCRQQSRSNRGSAFSAALATGFPVQFPELPWAEDPWPLHMLRHRE
jgi:hypothetical protein